jgi:protein-S-isoprenylcysteine O-methyltransferase Ste14
MAAVALALYIAFGILALGWRLWLQRRRTGSSGFHRISRQIGRLGVCANVMFVVAMVLGLAAPLLQLFGVVSPLAILDHGWIHAIGFGLALLGLAGTVYAQLDMGESWRVGVDLTETTTLVRDGTFAWMRNPIYGAMLVFMLGEVLLATNPVGIVVFAILLISVEIQVRFVEEPYLLGVHGDVYRDYTAGVGRFVPAIGRIR